MISDRPIYQLNCDMGEGVEQEAELMPLIDACSVACGGHTGNSDTMATTVKLALKYHIEIGAHPSFPDRENFGRIAMQIKPSVLVESLIEQVKTLEAICLEYETHLSHIKPHGALYNLATTNLEAAQSVVALMQHFPGLTLLAPWQSVVAQLARKNLIPIRFEGFADRKYDHNGHLANRSLPNAVIADPRESLKQVMEVVRNQRIPTMAGNFLDFQADTFCIHGDNPAALAIARSLTQKTP